MLRRYAVGVVLLLGLWAGPVRGQTKLEWKLKEGDRFYQEITTSAKQVLKTAGEESKKDINVTIVTSLSVAKQIPDNSTVIEQKIESVKFNNPMPAPGLDEILKRMQGATFRITLYPKFRVTKFGGYEELVKRIAGDEPVMAKIVRSQLTEEDLTRDVEQLFALLPDQAVRKGDTWDRQLVVTPPAGAFGRFDTVYHCTYEGGDTVEGKAAEKISFTATAKYVPAKTGDGDLPFKITKSDMRADEMKGTFWFDAAAGRLVQSELKMRVKGVMTVSFEGQSFDQEMGTDQTIKARILDKNPLQK